MSTRTSSLLVTVALLLGACAPESGAPDGEKIDCALGRGEAFKANCTLQIAANENETFLVIHHPDGDFRRFVFSPATGGFLTADGADTLETFVDRDGVREIKLADNRYRIPPRLLRIDP